MRYILMLLFFMNTCDEPGIKYKVQVLSSNQPANNYYCTYRIKSVDTNVLPQDYVVDKCGKYNVGDVITIEINDLK